MKTIAAFVLALVVSCGGEQANYPRQFEETKRGELQVTQDNWFAGVKLLTSTPFRDIGCQYRPADQQATGFGHFYNQCSLIAGGEWMSFGIETTVVSGFRTHTPYMWLSSSSQVTVPNCPIGNSTSYVAGVTLNAINNDPSQVVSADLVLNGYNGSNPIQVCTLQYVLPGGPRPFAPGTAFWNLVRDGNGGQMPPFTTYSLTLLNATRFDGVTKQPDPNDGPFTKLVDMWAFDNSHRMIRSAIPFIGRVTLTREAGQ